MRIIRPEELQQAKKRNKKKASRRHLAIVSLALGTGLLVYFLTPVLSSWTDRRSDISQVPNQNEEQRTTQIPVKDTLKEFEPQAFNDIALGLQYPNTQLFDDPPTITGNSQADARVRSLAEARGYKLTSTPMGAIQKLDEPLLYGDDLLQSRAAIAWQDLKQAAKQDNMPLALLSAYRSPEYQRKLFMQRLTAQGVRVYQIVSGTADAAIERVLQTTAPPGYSRHHTGYTIDLWCEDGSGAFLASKCFRWISANNYQIAKENGWIPSYPDGVNMQGPEPEPWEYVWASRDVLYE